MKNIIILGSGRSGTSMVTGTFARAGYYMGSYIYSPTPTNFKGVFEDEEINNINEKILSKSVCRRAFIANQWFSRYKPITAQRWLQKMPLNAKLFSSKEIEERIQKITKNLPFCFKDPRFSYSLPVWRPFLKNSVFICVFRDPASTAMSILKECRSRQYLKNLRINFKIAAEVWSLMYSHILRKHIKEGDWLFLHYDQVLTETGLDKLESFTGSQIDRSFPERSMRSSFSDATVPRATSEIYKRLCELAQCDKVKYNYRQLQKAG